jgi:hypothetical protein
MALTRFSDSESLASDIDELAKQLEKLRLSYEQYFLGLEKREPSKERAHVQRLIREKSGSGVQNTRLKFRLQQLVARYNTFSVHWDRTLRLIEEGRYERDVFKAKIHEKERGIQSGSTPEKRMASPKAGAAIDPIASLFEKYVAAKRQCGEDIGKTSYHQFQKTMKNQIDVIKKKTGATGVKFQISTESGKAKIKAIPQKKIEKKA